MATISSREPPNPGTEIETSRRLTVAGFVFEEKLNSGGGDGGSINVTGNGIETLELEDSDVDNILRFFASYQRRARRDGDPTPSNDGRGQVTDESTDKRLRGNRG